MSFDKDLPDELQEYGPDTSAKKGMSYAEKQQKIEALGEAIAKKRDEAVKARKDSGIEEIWTACEEAYLCIDDANRGEYSGAKWAKPIAMNAPVTANDPRPANNKSTAYVRLTARYVDAGAARISETVLPIDGKAFSFGPTPDPDLTQLQEDKTQVAFGGQALTRDPTPEELAAIPPGQPAPTGVPLTVADLAKEKMDMAAKAAEKAEQRIYDWMVESNYPAEMRKVLFDASRIGVGVLKGPVPSFKRNKAAIKTPKGYVLEISDKVQPGYKWMDPWDFFPDGTCGENIQDGDFVFERDYISPRKLRQLKREKGPDGTPIYMADQIDKVYAEGPGKHKKDEGNNPSDKKNDKRFEIWYFTGTLTRAEMEASRTIGLEDLPDELFEATAIVTLVNDTVIRSTLHPLDSGEFTYHPMPWSRRAGSWTGVGPGEQCFLPQRMVNAATRTLLNNAGLAAGSQIVIDRNLIAPMNDSWIVTPDKFWETNDGVVVEDVRKAMHIFQIPSVGKELMAIIDYGFKLAEEATNIPLISQGQANENTPETFGSAEIHNDNANALLRHLGYTVDDHITEPVVHQSYEYLLMDPDVPAEEKGDFEINARGSIAMVEKEIQQRFLLSQAPIVTNPVFELSPTRWIEEVYRGNRMDPAKFQLTDQEKKDAANKPPPEDPRVTAANIQAKARTDAAGIMAQVTVARTKADTDRDTVYVNAEAEKNRNDHDARMRELEVEERLTLMKYAMTQRISLDDAKVQLTKTTMELNTQVRLATATGKTQQVAPAAVEPVGRAPNGEAFQA